MNALGNLQRTQRSLASTFRNISSGQRINQAADDAAGLAVAENLDSHERSSRVAARNINDGLSLIQTYEGAVNEVADILKRQRELAIQSSSETMADTERAYADQEFYTLAQEMNRIAATTNFNGSGLTSKTTAGGQQKNFSGPGSYAGKSFDVQVGVNDSADDRIQIGLRTLDTGEMLSEYAFHVFTEHGAPPGMVPGVTDDLNARDPSSGPPPAGSESFSIGSVDTARMSLQAIDFQIDYVNKARSSVGAVQNRLDSALNNIETYTENLGASESRIRDADFAHETAEMSKFQVMQQAGVAILGQANGMSQGALRLI